MTLVLGKLFMLPLTPPVVELRKQVLHEIVPTLFSNHDYSQLYTKFRQTSSRVTYIVLQPEKLTFPSHIISGVVKESAFEKGYVNQGTVKVHKLKNEDLESV